MRQDFFWREFRRGMGIGRGERPAGAPRTFKTYLRHKLAVTLPMMLVIGGLAAVQGRMPLSSPKFFLFIMCLVAAAVGSSAVSAYLSLRRALRRGDGDSGPR